MPSTFPSIRVWLAGAFLLVSVLTALTIALYVLPKAEREFAQLSERAGAVDAERAAAAVSSAATPKRVQDEVKALTGLRHMSLWIYDARRQSQTRFRNTIPGLDEQVGEAQKGPAIDAALAGRRYDSRPSATDGRLIGIPVLLPPDQPGAGRTRAALVAYFPATAFAAEADSVLRRELLYGAAVALFLALVVSTLIAAYVARRIRRISGAAEAIAAGDFSRRLADGSRDEIGRLAGSVDEMRRKLASAFASLTGERERLARVLDRLEEGVIAIDGDGVVQLANPAAVALLGGTVERGRELPAETPASGLAAFARSAARGRCAPEAEIRTEQGRILRVQAVGLGGDRPDDTLIVLSDRTADRRREEVEQRFVANASHELRTPLAAIVAAVEVLQDGAKDDPEAADTFLEDISRHARRLERLADTLLTLARLGTGELRPELHDVDAGVVVGRVGTLMGSLAAAGGITIETHGDALLRADEDLVEQVVIGLVGNAVKHTPRGGRITISAEAGSDTGTITVADTGSGIDASHLPRVFDQFWRADVSRSRGGFGLGLAIGREFISAMGGTLTVASEPDVGTTVTIHLPVARPAAAPAAPVVPARGAERLAARSGD